MRAHVVDAGTLASIKEKKIPMKRKIIFFLIAFCISNTITSQIEYGIKGGLNYSIVELKFNNSKLQEELNNRGGNNEYLPYFHFGLYGKKNLKNDFFILTELLYSREGYRTSENPLTGAERVKLNYINIPILIGYKPIPKITLVMGADISYLMKAKAKNKLSDFYEIDFYSNKIEVGGILGLSFSIIKKLEIETRYIHGLSSLRKVETIRLTDDIGNFTEEAKLRYKSKVFQISLKYRL
jgi:hypothetical protein